MNTTKRVNRDQAVRLAEHYLSEAVHGMAKYLAAEQEFDEHETYLRRQYVYMEDRELTVLLAEDKRLHLLSDKAAYWRERVRLCSDMQKSMLEHIKFIDNKNRSQI